MSEKIVNGVDFVCIPTQDATAAKKFYEEVLGLEQTIQWGDMPAYEFEAGNLTLAIMQMDAFGQEFKPNGGAIALHVDDFEAAKSELASRGIEFQMDTIDSGVCHQVYFADPDGNPIGIHNRYAPRD